jgi:hypothetical protein
MRAHVEAEDDGIGDCSSNAQALEPHGVWAGHGRHHAERAWRRHPEKVDEQTGGKQVDTRVQLDPDGERRERGCGERVALRRAQGLRQEYVPRGQHRRNDAQEGVRGLQRLPAEAEQHRQ